MLKALSIQIADSVDIKLFKTDFPEGIYYADSEELFYRVSDGQYVYVFRYGIVCFLGFDEAGVKAFIERITPYCTNLFELRNSEEFDIEINAPINKFGYNKVEIEQSDIDSLRLIMLNVSQSVALDYFDQQANILLRETNYYTQQLEKRGKLELSARELKKYIGRSLILKSRIASNLYIFDSPEETWENESLNKLDIGLKQTFDLQARFRTIREGLEIAKENLELFKDLLQYRNSILLEWIIIILILVEVINLFFEKLFQ
jgi:required for meiotic nuclear division protein 1